MATRVPADRPKDYVESGKDAVVGWFGRIAEAVPTDHVLIARDDFHHPEWPEVSAGFFDWYKKRKRAIVPLAIGFNKLYLCQEADQAAYLRGLNADPLLRALAVRPANFKTLKYRSTANFLSLNLASANLFAPICAFARPNGSSEHVNCSSVDS